MGEAKHVVIWDPSGEYWEGGIVDAEVATPLRGRGVATLPVESNLVGRSAVGGWFKKAWGSGWPLGTSSPRLTCPMVLYVARDANPSVATARRLYFAARLVPDAETLEAVGQGKQLSGMLRFSPDSGQPGTFSGGVGDATAVDPKQLPPPDERGGWTVYGQARVSSPVDGMLGLGIYASAPGLLVAWAAVSQSR
jgi:hypothetical protein